MMLPLLCAAVSAAPKVSLILGPNTADDTPVGDFSPSGDAAFDATYSFYEDLEVDEVVQDFILRNDGDEDLILSGGQVWDDTELPLTLDDCAGEVTLAPGERCSFGLGVLALAATPGSYSSYTEIETNDPERALWSFEGSWSKPAADSGCSSTGSGLPAWALLGTLALLFRRRGQAGSA